MAIAIEAINDRDLLSDMTTAFGNVPINLSARFK
jgi:hypothetical protein